MEKVKNSWSKILNDYLEFIGEPSDSKKRNAIIFVLAVTYFFFGIYFWKNPGNIILESMGYDNGISGFILTLLLIISGFYMLVYWAFLMSKIKYNKKNIILSNKTICWGLKLLFVLILPIEIGKRIVYFVLSATRQKETVQYIPEFFLSLLITLIIFQNVILRFSRMIFQHIEMNYSLHVTDELIAFLMVLSIISLFFILTKLLICLTVIMLIWDEQWIRVREKSKKNVLGTMQDEDHKKERHDEYISRKRQMDIELNYSKLYFYMIVNIVLLCLHFNENEVYGKLFASDFMGVTTLSALLREAKTNIEHERIVRGTK